MEAFVSGFRREGRMMLQLVAMLAGILLASGAAAEGRWTKLAPFPQPSEELLGASAGGKFYVFCGLAPGWKPTAMVYEYDPATDHWTKKKPMGLASHHVAIAEYHGKIYVFGGFTAPASGPAGWVPTNAAWEYDPVADTWKALAPMPTKRGAAVAAAAGDKIYVIGGAAALPSATDPMINPMRPHRSLATVEEYDPATNAWRERAPMLTPRNHTTAGTVNGKIYVIGGRIGGAFITGAANNIDLVEEYNPATDVWTPVRARMPTARSAMASGVYNGRIYVTGGEGQDGRMMSTYRAFEVFDPASGAWATLPSMPVGRHGLAGGVVGNRLHMVSGDVQSAGSGVEVHTNSHDAYEFESAKK